MEKRKADVRIIAATNKNLESEVKKGTFRDDLYFRLNVVKLHIPPLRERPEDILPLVRFFIDRFNEQFKKLFVTISSGAEDRILSYPWPGNVREIRNAVERIVLLEREDTIQEKHLSFLAKGEGPPCDAPPFKPVIPFQGIVLDEVEKAYILEALKAKKGNKIQAAKILGISRSALLYRMQKYGIKMDRLEGPSRKAGLEDRAKALEVRGWRPDAEDFRFILEPHLFDNKQSICK